MRDSFILYRSFYEAIKDLPKDNQLELYNAIFEYSLNFKEVELSGISATVFKLIKPNLEANNQRYINGKQPKEKQDGSKQEAKQKQTKSKPKANKDEDEDKDVNKDKDKELLFERFWNLYDRKEGRKDCLSKFLKLSKSNIDKIFETLPAYIASTPDKKYRKMPETYLNGEHWNDEIAGQKLTPNQAPAGFYYNYKGELRKIEKDEW